MLAACVLAGSAPSRPCVSVALAPVAAPMARLPPLYCFVVLAFATAVVLLQLRELRTQYLRRQTPPSPPPPPPPPPQMCWRAHVGVELTDLLGGDDEVSRCARRRSSLRRAKLACEVEPRCGGVTRDNGIWCDTADSRRRLPFELRRGVQRAEFGRMTWTPEQLSNVSGACASAWEHDDSSAYDSSEFAADVAIICDIRHDGV